MCPASRYAQHTGRPVEGAEAWLRGARRSARSGGGRAPGSGGSTARGGVPRVIAERLQRGAGVLQPLDATGQLAGVERSQDRSAEGVPRSVARGQCGDRRAVELTQAIEAALLLGRDVFDQPGKVLTPSHGHADAELVVGDG